jgi:hypothetical protein
MISSISSSKTTTSSRAELRSAVNVAGMWYERDVTHRETADEPLDARNVKSRKAAENALDERNAMNRETTEKALGERDVKDGGLAISHFSD